MADTPDSNLIQKAITGDQRSFTQLLNRYRGSIYNLIYKMVHNKEETEDLVQEALQEGAYGIIYKPLDIEKVVAFINKDMGGQGGVARLGG